MILNKRLKLYFENGDILNKYNVEYFNIILNENNGDILYVKYLKIKEHLAFEIIKDQNNLTNYDAVIEQEYSQIEKRYLIPRVVIYKDEWERQSVYSSPYNKIIRVDYDGKIVHQIIRDDDEYA